MLLRKVSSELGLEILNPSLPQWGERKVKWGFSSDLLSIVMSDANQGDLWITKQMHLNIVAVAMLNELSGVVICGKKPDEKTIQKAVDENIPILYSEASAFETAGKLYKLLTDEDQGHQADRADHTDQANQPDHE